MDGHDAKLNADANQIIATSEVTKLLKDDGTDPVGNTPTYFAKFLREDVERWAKVVRKAGVEAE